MAGEFPAWAAAARRASEANFGELLSGALCVPNVARGFLVGPALFPRLAQAARGRLARLDSALGELVFTRRGSNQFR